MRHRITYGVPVGRRPSCDAPSIGVFLMLRNYPVVYAPDSIDTKDKWPKSWTDFDKNWAGNCFAIPYSYAHRKTLPRAIFPAAPAKQKRQTPSYRCFIKQHARACFSAHAQNRFRFLAADAHSAIASGSRAATTAAGPKRRQEQLHLVEIIY